MLLVRHRRRSARSHQPTRSPRSRMHSRTHSRTCGSRSTWTARTHRPTALHRLPLTRSSRSLINRSARSRTCRRTHRRTRPRRRRRCGKCRILRPRLRKSRCQIRSGWHYRPLRRLPHWVDFLTRLRCSRTRRRSGRGAPGAPIGRGAIGAPGLGPAGRGAIGVPGAPTRLTTALGGSGCRGPVKTWPGRGAPGAVGIGRATGGTGRPVHVRARDRPVRCPAGSACELAVRLDRRLGRHRRLVAAAALMQPAEPLERESAAAGAAGFGAIGNPAINGGRIPGIGGRIGPDANGGRNPSRGAGFSSSWGAAGAAASTGLSSFVSPRLRSRAAPISSGVPAVLLRRAVSSCSARRGCWPSGVVRPFACRCQAPQRVPPVILRQETRGATARPHLRQRNSSESSRLFPVLLVCRE